MPDGLWNVGANDIASTQQGMESIRRAGFVRHRLLQVNLSNAGTLFTGDASSWASQDPNTLVNLNQEGGPHFDFSPETPDGSHTFGFEWTLFNNGIQTPAVPDATGFIVTIWELIGNAQSGSTISSPIWASFLPRTNVNYRELYHSFDVNATAIRFQITNVSGVGPGLESSIGIAFAEL